MNPSQVSLRTAFEVRNPNESIYNKAIVMNRGKLTKPYDSSIGESYQEDDSKEN